MTEILSHSPELIASVLTVFAQVLIAEYAFVFIGWYAMANGLMDKAGTVLGADFLNVYAAGVQVNRGQPDMAYDWAVHHQVSQAVAGFASPRFTSWHYPPLFLAVAALVALFPYLWAFGLYTAAGLAGYWAVVRRIAPRAKHALWMLAAFPGVFDNLVNGQNGFITASLFGAGLLTLEDRPWLAGTMFGLLAYKPQLFVVIPLILAVSGHGRATLATIITAVTSAALSWVMFGTATWLAFLGNLDSTQHIELERGILGGNSWDKLQSVFSMVRMWGGDIATAYALQGIVALAALACAAWIWRSKTTLATRAAALCAAVLLATPYVLDYDLVILAVPLAYLVRQGMETGFRRYEKIILAALWLLPLVARIWGGHSLPITPPVLIALMGLCVARTIPASTAAAVPR